MQRWMNWLHITNLVEDLQDDGLQQPDYQQERGMFKPLKSVVLTDGDPINLEDQAVAHFLKMIEVDVDDPESNLKHVTWRLQTWMLINLKKPGIHGYESKDLDDLMALRSMQNGWRELDRIINQVSGRTFTSKVDRANESIIFSSQDDGLGGDSYYAISLLHSSSAESNRDHVAFASTSAIALGLIDEVLKREGMRYALYGDGFTTTAPDSFHLTKNNAIQFSVPIKPAVVHETDPEDRMEITIRNDYTNLHADWSSTHWYKHDREILKSISAVLPKMVSSLIKGSFLGEELGI